MEKKLIFNLLTFAMNSVVDFVENVLSIQGIAQELKEWLLPSSIIRLCLATKRLNNSYNTLIDCKLVHYSWRAGFSPYSLTCQEINGVKHGLAFNFFKNGRLYHHESYKDGVRHGISKTWYVNGILQYEENWENGVRHGQYRDWHDNGSLKTESFFIHGDMHGKQNDSYYSWDRNEKLTYQYQYETLTNGKKHKICMAWGSNGNLKEVSSFKNNNMFDKVNTFYWYETYPYRFKCFMEFKDNNLHGDSMLFLNDGERCLYKKYENGLMSCVYDI